MPWAEVGHVPAKQRPAPFPLYKLSHVRSRLLVHLTDTRGTVWCFSEDTAREFYAGLCEAVRLQEGDRFTDDEQPGHVLRRREGQFAEGFLKALLAQRRRNL